MTRADPTKQRFPNLKGVLMVDTSRGKVRVRSWPKKRGRPKSEAVRDQNRWFKEACRNMNYVDAGQMRLAISAAKGTGLYPRDILMNAMAGGFLEFEMADGRLIKYRKPFLEEVMFQGCTLHQTVKNTIPAGTNTVMQFGTPVFDTAGFWDAGAPSRLTIPPNVSIVSIEAFFTTDAITNTGSVVLYFFKNGAEFQRWQGTWSTWPMFGSFTGPQPVVAGDYFEMWMYCSDANRSSGDGRTFFSLQVLQVP